MYIKNLLARQKYQQNLHDSIDLDHPRKVSGGHCGLILLLCGVFFLSEVGLEPQV